MRTDTEDLETLSHLLSTRQIRPLVQRVVPFTTAGIRMGHRLLEDGHVVGKLVLGVNEALV